MTVEQVGLDVPSDPTILQQVCDGLAEISRSKARVKGEQDFQTKAFQELAEKTGVSNQALRKLANFVDNADKLKAEVDSLDLFADRLKGFTPKPVVD